MADYNVETFEQEDGGLRIVVDIPDKDVLYFAALGVKKVIEDYIMSEQLSEDLLEEMEPEELEELDELELDEWGYEIEEDELLDDEDEEGGTP